MQVSVSFAEASQAELPLTIDVEKLKVKGHDIVSAALRHAFKAFVLPAELLKYRLISLPSGVELHEGNDLIEHCLNYEVEEPIRLHL